MTDLDQRALAVFHARYDGLDTTPDDVIMSTYTFTFIRLDLAVQDLRSAIRSSIADTLERLADRIGRR
jgi:hypothetical protein